MTLFTARSGTKRRRHVARRSLIAMVAVGAAVAATLTLGAGAANAANTPLISNSVAASSVQAYARNVTYTLKFVPSVSQTLSSIFYGAYNNGPTANFQTATVTSVTGITGATAASTSINQSASPVTLNFSGTASDTQGTQVTIVISGVTNGSLVGSINMAFIVSGSNGLDYLDIPSPTYTPGPGALTGVTQTPSTTAAQATNVTWGVGFTTATAGSISSFSIAGAPTGQSSIGIGNVTNIGPGTVSYSATNGLTYTVTTPINVPAGQVIAVQFTGVANPVAGTYTSTSLPITTMNNAASPLAIDSGYSPTLVFGGTNSVVTAQVAKSLGFTIDSPSYTLALDPSIASLSDVSRPVKLTVITNAGQGYTITMADTGLKTVAGTSATVRSIGPSSALASTAFATNSFGVSAVATASKSQASVPAGFTGSNISGYSTTATPLVTATLPTGGTADTIALINRVKIDYNTPAGSYSDTITYTATPAY